MPDIFYDSEAYFTPVGDAHEQYLPNIETKMPIPCGSCSVIDKCTIDGTDCTAFRRWTRLGEYKVGKIGRLVKPFSIREE